MATFTIAVDFGAASRRQPRVLSTKFGDGYEQRAADGIHADLQVWNVSWPNRETSVANTIEGFFITHAGMTAFTWTPPGSVTASQWLCKSWTRSPSGYDLENISAIFEEVPDPA